MSVSSYVLPGSRLDGDKINLVAARSSSGDYAHGVMLVAEDGEPATTPNGAVRVGTASDRFYTQCGSFDLVNDWEVLSAAALSGLGAFDPGEAAGMTLSPSQGGAADGTTPYHVISSGVGANRATLLLARAILRPPVEMRVGITMSQRLSECQVLAGFFECDPETGALVRDSTFRTADTFLNIRNMAAIRLDGTTATQANPIYRASGAGAFTVGATSFSGFTSVAGGTGPNFTCPDLLRLHYERTRLIWTSTDANANSVGTTTVIRDDAVPNPTLTYRFGVIVMNVGTPGSSTDVRLHFVNLLSSARLDVSPRVASTDAGSAFPVTVQGAPPISGQAAHDAVISGNPMRVGARAVTTNYAAVASGDQADLISTAVGALIVKPNAIPEHSWNYPAAAGGITGNADVQVRAAGAAGIRNYVTSMQIRNVSATATEFLIKDGASTVLWRDFLPANSAPPPITFSDPLRGSAATALNVQCVTAGAQVFVNLQGHFAP